MQHHPPACRLPGRVTHLPPAPAARPRRPRPRPLPQLSVPQLRPGSAQRTFTSDLAAYEYDLNRWRK